MTTYEDILASRAEREAATRSAKDAILEASGSKKARTATEGEVTSRKSGEFGEGVAIWAAKERARKAIADLRESIMRSDSAKGIYVAEAEAKAFAEQAYILAATTSAHEETRQDAVTAAVEQRVETISKTANGR